jgi:lysozyme
LYLKEYVIHANLEKKRSEEVQRPNTVTKYHTVVSGDNLGSIARKYNVTVKQIVEWNKLANPDALSIGQKLRVTVSSSSKSATSSKSTTKYHTVVSGDTLGAIASKYKTTVKQIVEWNKLSNPDALKLGQKLRVSK